MLTALFECNTPQTSQQHKGCRHELQAQRRPGSASRQASYWCSQLCWKATLLRLAGLPQTGILYSRSILSKHEGKSPILTLFMLWLGAARLWLCSAFRTDDGTCSRETELERFSTAERLPVRAISLRCSMGLKTRNGTGVNIFSRTANWAF
jgi:hypothetical protein